MQPTKARVMKEMRIRCSTSGAAPTGSGSGAVNPSIPPRSIMVITMAVMLLLSTLLQYSEAFVAPAATRARSASFRSGGTSLTAVGAGPQGKNIAVLRTRLDARRERMATLAKVPRPGFPSSTTRRRSSGCCSSSSNFLAGQSRARGGQFLGRGRSTWSGVGDDCCSYDSRVPTVRMGAGGRGEGGKGGVRRGLRRARRAVARVWRRGSGGGGKVRYHTCVSVHVSRIIHSKHIVSSRLKISCRL